MAKHIFTLTLSLLFAVSLMGQTLFESSSAGTHKLVVPQGYNYTVTVEVWGAGAGGGKNNTPQGGGGGGAYARSVLTLGPGSYAIQVGAGGGPGTNGGESSFERLVVAAGGSTGGVQGGLGGSDRTSVGDVKQKGQDGMAPLGDNGGDGGDGANAPGTGGAGSSRNGQGQGRDGGDGLTPGGGGGGRGIDGNGNKPKLGVSGNGGNGKVKVALVQSQSDSEGSSSSQQQVLPIELISFSGRQTGPQVELNWRTASEQNNDYMAIERSTDGQHFSEIGRIDGAGTTTQEQVYRFLDQRPLPGANYYRLRQVDFGGAFEYSAIVAVQSQGSALALQVYPNPAVNTLTVANATGEARIFNATGQQLLHTTLREAGTAIDVSLLPAGQYFLLVTDQFGGRQTTSFSK